MDAWFGSGTARMDGWIGCMGGSMDGLMDGWTGGGGSCDMPAPPADSIVARSFCGAGSWPMLSVVVHAALRAAWRCYSVEYSSVRYGTTAWQQAEEKEKSVVWRDVKACVCEKVTQV
eukprot:365964-Chlamydomonas_euryale.AAC.7